MKEYALYKGDKFLDIGTIKDLAERFNVLPSTMRYYMSDAYKRRSKNDYNNKRILIPLDKDIE